MYKEAASLGIDLMGYDDSDHSSTERYSGSVVKTKI